MAINLATNTTEIANKKSQGRNLKNRMWPSFETAVQLYDNANIFLIGALVVGVIATVLVVWMGNVKEEYLRRDLAEAHKEAAEARKEAANAEERIEKLHGENLRLEEQIAPRRLTSERQNAIAKSLEMFKGRKIRIESYSLDAEGEVLAEQIRSAVAPIFNIDDWIGSERASKGFAKGINVTGSDKLLVNKLAEVLKTSGLSGITRVALPTGGQVYLLAEGPSKARDVDAVILVGAKPVAQP